MNQSSNFENILDIYKYLEPENSDSWNPLDSNNELYHRMMLLNVFCQILRIIKANKQTSILDIGCGVGRSTRIFVEFGISPAQIKGVDLRSDALETAKSFNPLIHYQSIKQLDELKHDSPYDLISLCTVLSSLNIEQRKQLLNDIWSLMKPNTYLLIWDRIHANSFAGSDDLNLNEIAPGELIWKQFVNLKLFPYMLKPSNYSSFSLQERLHYILSISRYLFFNKGKEMTHQALLMQK